MTETPTAIPVAQPMLELGVSERIDQIAALWFADYHHRVVADWPIGPDVDVLSLPGIVASNVSDYSEDVVLQHARLVKRSGQIFVQCFDHDPEKAAARLAEIRELIPRGSNPDPDIVPITFWSYGQHGARSIRRDLDADEWSTIEPNYPGETGERLGRTMSDFTPGLGGQLILWHGPPGTGKTTALRSLAREWKGWADLHYIVDADRFFGERADYMIDVMMDEDDGVAEPGDPSGEQKPRWRVLVLEDCGEMLQPDAQREVGRQALSRFLNTCDGLIGRGLRILILVTTNEPVGKLHEAVSRPGRCAAEIEFVSFEASEAERWLDERGFSKGFSNNKTLADLYAEIDGFRARSNRPKVGFAA